MAVRIRMKKMGRRHRPFFRICAIDGRAPRDGKVIEELGHYDPMVKETDARAILKGPRIDHWLEVGAQPSDNVRVLIKKYGTNGTHLQQQQEALERLKVHPPAPEPVAVELPEKEVETTANEAPIEAVAAETPAEEGAVEEATNETSTEEEAGEAEKPAE